MKCIALFLSCAAVALAQYQPRISYGADFRGPLEAGAAPTTRPNRTGAGSPVGTQACSTLGETYFQSDATAGQNLFGCTTVGSSDVAVWKLMGNGYPIRMGTGSPQGAQACTAVGELFFQTNATAGQNLFGCTGTGTSSTATWALQSGSGGGSTDPVNTGAGKGVFFPMGTLSYGPNGVTVSTSSANRGARYQFIVPFKLEFRYIKFYVHVASGTSCTGGTCGMGLAVYSYDMATKLAGTDVATSGGTPDLNTTGAKRVAVSSGTEVTGGVAVLTPGVYWLVSTSDSTTLSVAAFGENRLSLTVNAGSDGFYGYATTSLSSGNGPSLTFTSDLSGASWTPYANAQSVMFAVFTN